MEHHEYGRKSDGRWSIPPVERLRIGACSSFWFAGGRTIMADPNHWPSFWPKYCKNGPAGTMFCSSSLRLSIPVFIIIFASSLRESFVDTGQYKTPWTRYKKFLHIFSDGQLCWHWSVNIILFCCFISGIHADLYMKRPYGDGDSDDNILILEQTGILHLCRPFSISLSSWIYVIFWPLPHELAGQPTLVWLKHWTIQRALTSPIVLEILHTVTAMKLDSDIGITPPNDRKSLK